MSDQMIDALIVFLVGALVGMGELIARYRDNPTRALRTLPAITYITINGLASLLALMAILTFGWIADGEATPQAQRLTRILAAGFGAMALLRTSLFVVRVGSTDVGIGPVAFLQILLAATDRGVDRKRASDRAETVVRIMDKLDFNIAFNSLPPFAMMLMQNLTLEDQTAIAAQVKGLVQPDSKVPNQTRVLNLGLMLMNYVGEDVLEDAVRGIQGQPQASGRGWGRGLTRDRAPGTTDGSSAADGSPAPATGGSANATNGSAAATAAGATGGSTPATGGSTRATAGAPAATGAAPAANAGPAPATDGGAATSSRRRGRTAAGGVAGSTEPGPGGDPPPGTTAAGTPLPREEDAPEPGA